ncbi:hypothetical protein KW785_01740 [Candidatus Parcubacteria bacterium]|nr:hypothetical protein [Candidatus Parcubacteria bacterium]
MPKYFLRKFKNGLSKKYQDINPEDIFLDSTNLPGLNHERLEGRMEQPITEKTFLFLKFVFVIIAIFLAGKLGTLEIMKGKVYAEISETNRLDRTIIFADRGVIYDRNHVVLASNAVKTDGSEYAARVYAPFEGLAPVLGYVKYPSKDSSGNYYDEDYHGQAGVEKVYDKELAGANGSKLIETDARGQVASEGVVDDPQSGKDLTLSIDAPLTQKLYQSMASLAAERGFVGGAGVIMDVRTGEIVALASYPDYDPNVITEGADQAEIARLLSAPSKPFLNRAVAGLYTPGSIVKPIVALGALSEGVIDPLKSILSTGSISLPNPYFPDKPSVFRDWKAHGWINMREALAVSSDVYFYEVGGGFQDQRGLGITKLDNYFTLFGMAERTGIDLPGEAEGYIANQAWKAENFPDDPTWRIGDTYHTAIGQYGTQVTPLEAVRWVGALANGGKLLVPSVVAGGKSEDKRIFRTLTIAENDFQIVREGMRQGVNGGGVVAALNTPAVAIAGKTGTAELGAKKQFVNSWVTGFFPYGNPHYAFAIIMEKGPVANLVGAPSAFRQVIDWMAENTPQYFE